MLLNTADWYHIPLLLNIHGAPLYYSGGHTIKKGHPSHGKKWVNYRVDIVKTVESVFIADTYMRACINNSSSMNEQFYNNVSSKLCIG